MNISASQKSESSTESVLIKSGGGSRDSDSEPNPDNRQLKPSTKNMSPSDPALSPELSFTSGTKRKRQPCSMECNIQGPFQIRNNGSIGQEIFDTDGRIIAWTTDVIVAQVICKVLNENEGVLG